MEFIFGIIALLAAIGMIYGIGRLVYSHNALIRAYEHNELMLTFHMLIGAILWCMLFMTLCAFNNTFWGLPYLTA